MQGEQKCNFPQCNNFKSNPRVSKIFHCKCCKLSFCTDSCLVEHLIFKEKEKSNSNSKSNTKNSNNTQAKSNNVKFFDLSPAQKKLPGSIFIKPGTMLREKEKNSYFDFNNFEKLKKTNSNKFHVLGSGAFGEVFLAKNKLDGKLFAIKQMDKARLTSIGVKFEIIYREINIHIKLVHDHIARLHSYHEDTSSFYLILEYIEAGTLFSVIQKSKGLSEEESFKYFIQIASALNFLHENNLIHRDLKPENCLIDKEGNVKLCDFGWTVEGGNSRVTFCGTYEYMAPEIIKEMPYNSSIDVWSLGILLFELLHSYSPFRAKNKANDYNYENYDPSVEVLKNILKNNMKIVSLQ